MTRGFLRAAPPGIQPGTQGFSVLCYTILIIKTLYLKISIRILFLPQHMPNYLPFLKVVHSI